MRCLWKLICILALGLPLWGPAYSNGHYLPLDKHWDCPYGVQHIRMAIIYPWINQIIKVIIMRDGPGVWRRLLDLAGWVSGKFSACARRRAPDRARNASCMHQLALHAYVVIWSISSSRPGGPRASSPLPSAWCGYGLQVALWCDSSPIDSLYACWPLYRLLVFTCCAQ
jgi:hypothetical protein